MFVLRAVLAMLFCGLLLTWPLICFARCWRSLSSGHFVCNCSSVAVCSDVCVCMCVHADVCAARTSLSTCSRKESRKPLGILKHEWTSLTSKALNFHLELHGICYSLLRQTNIFFLLFIPHLLQRCHPIYSAPLKALSAGCTVGSFLHVNVHMFTAVLFHV